MLQTALEAVVEEYIQRCCSLVDEEGKRLVVRNGHMPERTILTGAGGLAVKQPRVHDRRAGERYSSSILPPYMRRSPSLDALNAYAEFLNLYKTKYPKACQCLEKDKDVLFQFYNFPAQHWQHIRTTNPIESTFGTVRHWTKRTKGCGNRLATLTMTFKLTREAEKHWRRINGCELIVKVFERVRFRDGIEENKAA